MRDGPLVDAGLHARGGRGGQKARVFADRDEAPAHIGAETQRPLAIVVIGGLVSATLLTLLTLLTLPALYLMLARRWPSSMASGDALPVH